MRTAIAAGVCLVLSSWASADWPMAGHDPQRTSWAPEDRMAPTLKPLWCKRMYPFDDPPHPNRINGGYIPMKVQIITVEGKNGGRDLVYVACARGVYALSPADGSVAWLYETQMPAGHSPTVADGVLYLSCYDKRIHAVNAQTGRVIWRTKKAGAGFDVSPLVVRGKVYAGCRDGFFYCFDAATGRKLWHYRTDGPIAYSAAHQVYPEYDDGLIFFASNDSRAYALRAEDHDGDGTGNLVWKSPERLPGDGFFAFWPVVSQNRVLLAGTMNHPDRRFVPLVAKTFPKSVTTDSRGRVNVSYIRDYLVQHPDARSFFVLDYKTGVETEVAPISWWGGGGTNRYPPAVGPNGLVWINTPWLKSWFGSGRYAGWEMGTTLIFPVPGPNKGLESADETTAWSIIGRDHLYYNSGQDWKDTGGIFKLGGGSVKSTAWWFASLRDAFGDYYGRWNDLKYGCYVVDNPKKPWGCFGGTVSHQNPPAPLRGRVYFHRSNSVICYGP